MSVEDKTGEILRLLTELTDLVKTLQPKVENHTHHHYPTSPTYYYPNTWTTGIGSGSGSGTFYPPNTSTGVPGTTSTWSTNDTNTPPE